MGNFKFKIDNEAKRIINLIYGWDIRTVGKFLEAGFEYNDKEKWLECDVKLKHINDWKIIIENLREWVYRIDIYDKENFSVELAHEKPGLYETKTDDHTPLRTLCWIDSLIKVNDIAKTFTEFKESVEDAYIEVGDNDGVPTLSTNSGTYTFQMDSSLGELMELEVIEPKPTKPKPTKTMFRLF